MQNEIIIEWKHIGRDIGNTCVRCGETGLAVIHAVEEIRPALGKDGIRVRIIETVLPDEEISESNSILFNGIPLEDLIEGMTVSTTPCISCMCITGQDEAECRVVEYEGTLYEAIPAGLIHLVIRKLAEGMNAGEEKS